MKKLYLALVLSCITFAGFGQTIVFSQFFTSGSAPSPTICSAWETFRSQLLSTYTYDSFNFAGSANPVGISCTDPTVTAAVANALRTGTSYSVSSGSYTWTVNAGCTAGGSCTSTPVEFGNTGSCACSTGYDVRPAIANLNWGGVNGSTCSAASQTITVTFYYTPPTPCSGTPTAGTAIGPSSACGSTPFSLSLTGSSFVSGLTYQWQSSTTGTAGSWTNISGATTLTYSATESSTTYYRCYVTCTSSSASDTSTSVSVPYGVCYCVPAFFYGTGYGYGCTDNMNVSSATYPFVITGAAGTSMSDPTNCVTSGYIDESSTSYTVSFIPGYTYNTTLGTNTNGYVMSDQIWIDFNADGVFQTSETVGGGTTSGATTFSTIRAYPTITIPSGVAPGNYRMRVITNYDCCTGTGYATYPNMYPCPTTSGSTEIYYGDARDYKVTVIPPPTVTPSPTSLNFGTIAVGLTSPTDSVTLNGMYLIGGSGNITITAPSNFQVSLDGASWATTVYQPFTGTSFGPTKLYVNFSPTAAVAYSGNITMTGGGITTPQVIPVTGTGSYAVVVPTPTSLAFGTIATGTYSPVQYVTITGLYLNPLVSNLTVTYSANFYSTTGGSSTYSVAYAGGIITSATIPCYFNPPAATSYTGTMTITGGGLLSPVVVPLSGAGGPPCSGTPSAGTATVSPGSGSSTTAFTLSLTGYTLATGLTFQWQSGPSSTGPWTNISGATNITYGFTGITANTFYQCIVTCSGFAAANSTAAEAVLMGCTPTSASWFASGTNTFNYTGSVQTFTVPTGVSSISIDMQGGKGGNSSVGALGGFGGRTQATLAVTAGTNIYVYVGGAGATASGAGIATGGTMAGGTSGQFAGGGGGGSDIRIGGTALSNRVVIAAGGGGAGYNCAATSEVGGFGGGLTGGAGYECGTATTCYTGSGGTSTAGGLGATCYTSIAGALGVGGNGIYVYSGGGGGGYYGGGGAAYGGGGGGSSFATSSATAVTLTSGYNSTGNGVVVITYATTSENPSMGINTFAVTPGTGAPLSDAGMCAAASTTTGYLDRTSLTPITLYQGCTHASSVTWGTVSNYQEGQVWIDFNSDGTFQTTEEVTPVFGYSTSTTPSPTLFNITIPSTAPTGTFLMRIRGINELASYGYALSSHLDPCLIQYLSTAPEYNDGDVVDYVVTIATPPNCTGTPTAGTAAVSPLSGVSTTPFTLTLTGYTTLVGGISFQWQDSSSATGGAWVNITGATSTTYSFTGISVSTYYRCVVSCSYSSTSATTGSVLATFTPTPSCVVTNASWFAESGSITYGANAFNIIGYSGSTLSDAGLVAAATSASPTAGYLSHTSMTPINMQVSGVYASSVTWGTTSPHQYCQVWIDFNNDGIFQSTESVSPVSGWNASATPQPTTFNITIPGTAATGVHLMRMRAIWEENSTDIGAAPAHCDPCLINYGGVNPAYWSGDEIDYLCNIVPITCTGTPTAGTASASVTTGCGPYSSTLTLTGSTSGTGITYQWQSSPDGTTWTNVSGATGTTYTASCTSTIYYRCIVTCTSSGLTATSNTVNLLNNASAITGTLTVCVGSTTTLADITTGGTWSSGSIGVATVTSGGVVTGASAGTATISYTTSCGTVTAIVTVNSSTVAAIAGSSTVCVGSTITLTDATSTGTWSSSASGTAGVGSSTGIVSGVAAGTATISYVTGCGNATQSVTVLASPTAISGAGSVCVGGTITLTDATAGGSWSSAITTIAGVGATTGIVTGATAGTTVISYATGCGTAAIALVTVNSAPAAITGATNLCVGSSITLADATGGGTWTSSSSTIASVGTTTGVVTGASAGIVTITYTTSCGSVTYLDTVIAGPSVVLGSVPMCIGGSITLTDSTTGGTWSSSSTGVAGVGSTTGIVTGASAGTATITYTAACGSSTAIVTVNGAPAAISGTATMCVGGSTTLADATTGGTWSSTNIGVATVGSTTGIVTGAAGGVDTINYTTTCGVASYTVTVNTVPAAITGSSFSVCGGLTITLADSTAGGTWSSASGTIAAVGSTTGIVTGGTAGSTTISYTTACGTSTATVYVNSASPAAITGTGTVCQYDSVLLSDVTPGGTWTSSTTTVATVSTSGEVTGVAAGTATISYNSGCGTPATFVVTVNTAPSAITGVTSVCAGIGSTTLSDSVAGGTWFSTATGTATVGASTGVVSGVAAGTVTISYTTSCGTATTIVTVNTGAPTAITGSNVVCDSGASVLTDGTAGGTWTSSNPGVASVGATTGIVTALTAGTSLITYSTGCGTNATTGFTVNPLPSPISGSATICSGAVLTLTDTVSGGTWSNGGSTVANIGSATGVVTGVAGGVATLTYSTGCGTVTANVTVNGAPAGIVGATSVCLGSTTSLTDSTTGGTWSSSNAGVASVDPTGTVTGVSAGTAVISYSAGTCGFSATLTMNVISAPASITGTPIVCVGTTASLGDATGGGTWVSSDSTIATVGTAGLMTGIATGTITISYVTGCGTATAPATVNGAVGAITGASSACIGSNDTLANTTTGGTWTSGSTGIATVSTGGIVTGVAAGTDMITYTTPYCGIVTTTVTVNGAPGPVGGSSTVCTGGFTTLTDGTGGGTWSSSDGTIATVGSTTGQVGGVAVGTVTISYSTSCGVSTYSETVNGTPSTIAGTPSVCIGASTPLTDATLGGTWSSGSPSIATVDISGNVTGVAVGLATISYTTSCGSATLTVSVNGAPAPITGGSSLCSTGTLALSDGGSSGTWSSTNTSVATVDATSGLVSGVSSGVDTIVFSSGCGTAASLAVTVNTSASAITGDSAVCAGSTDTLSESALGAVWSGGTAGVATVSSTGIVTGISAGTVTITASTACGAPATFNVTINPLPTGISGSPTVCQFGTISLVETGIGTWSSSNPAVAFVSGVGSVTGVSGGVANITYTLGTGCFTTHEVTVNPFPNAGGITGLDSVCVGATITLTDTAGASAGTWTSSYTGLATVSGGIVTGVASGVDTIHYNLTNGCGTGSAKKKIYVKALPSVSAIGGPATLCVGSTATFTDSISGGVWSSTAGTIATIGGTGIATGVAAGADSIVYTVANSCGTAKVATVITVKSAPSAIGGTMHVCVGVGDTLTNTATGGTWSTSDLGTATVTAGGVVTGVGGGVVTITYATGCGTAAMSTFTVNALPIAGVISGADSFCATASVTLSETVTGGTWSCSNTGASVASGVVTGVAAGVDTVVYTVGNICGTSLATFPVTVNGLPVAGVIFGSDSVCLGATQVYTATAPGGLWTLTNFNGGLTDTGVVTGVAVGNDTLVYTVTSMYCGSASTTFALAVNPLPNEGSITGTKTVCTGASSTLADGGSLGGTWSSINAAIAAVGATDGVVNGVAVGVDTIYYTVTNSCGTETAGVSVTVNTLPNAGTIAGNDTVCAFATITLSDVVSGGVWSSVDTMLADVTGGMVTGKVSGYDTILYAVTNMCGTRTATYPIYVQPLPSVGTIAGATSICVGSTITLTDSVTGGTWSGSSAVATVSGGIVLGLTAGIDTVVYQVTTHCGTATGAAIVTVDTPVTASIIGGSYACMSPGKEDTLYGVPAGGTWVSTNGFDSLIAGSAGSGMVMVKGGMLGLDTVRYNFGNSCGTSQATVNVTIFSAWQCDSIDYVKPVNKSASANGISIFPNPNTGSFTVGYPQGAVETNIIIMDIYGKVVASYVYTDRNANAATFNLDNAAAGTYLVKVVSDGTVYTGKVLVINR